MFKSTKDTKVTFKTLDPNIHRAYNYDNIGDNVVLKNSSNSSFMKKQDSAERIELFLNNEMHDDEY